MANNETSSVGSPEIQIQITNKNSKSKDLVNRAKWNNVNEAQLIDAYCQGIKENEGNMDPDLAKSQHWKTISDIMANQYNMKLDKAQCKNKWNSMKTDYICYLHMLSTPGFGLDGDPVNESLIGDYFIEYPKSKRYLKMPFPHKDIMDKAVALAAKCGVTSNKLEVDLLSSAIQVKPIDLTKRSTPSTPNTFEVPEKRQKINNSATIESSLNPSQNHPSDITAYTTNIIANFTPSTTTAASTATSSTTAASTTTSTSPTPVNILTNSSTASIPSSISNATNNIPSTNSISTPVRTPIVTSAQTTTNSTAKNATNGTTKVTFITSTAKTISNVTSTNPTANIHNNTVVNSDSASSSSLPPMLALPALFNEKALSQDLLNVVQSGFNRMCESIEFIGYSQMFREELKKPVYASILANEVKVMKISKLAENREAVRLLVHYFGERKEEYLEELLKKYT